MTVIIVFNLKLDLSFKKNVIKIWAIFSFKKIHFKISIFSNFKLGW